MSEEGELAVTLPGGDIVVTATGRYTADVYAESGTIEAGMRMAAIIGERRRARKPDAH